jgi:TP901 family phage tail tape measure protein
MSRVIDAVLRLRDEFTKPLGKSIDAMTSASKAGERTRKSINKFGKGIESVGKSLTTAVTVPIVGAATAAVKVASDFESSMSQVQATMGITKDATSELNGQTVNTMDALSQLAKDMGKSTKFSASEAADAINNMAMAGYDVQKTYDTLPTVLSLASAGALDLDYATQLVANGMAVMGDKVENAQQMADMMAVTASSAYGSVSDFGEALLVAGGQASVCGQNLADTYTALGILGDAGMQGSEGGTVLRNTLKNLYTPTDKAAKVLKKLGITTKDSSTGALLPMQDVLQQLQGKLGGMSEAAKADYMSQIFDTRTIAAANALMNQSGDRWDELNEKISGASDLYDGQGAAAGMAATQLDNMEGRITILKSSIEGLAISFGEILLPYAQKGVEYVQKLVDKFNSMDDSTKKNIVKYAAMAAAVGPVIMGFGKMIRISASLLGAFSKVRGAISGIVKAGGLMKYILGVMASPIGAIVAACAAVVAIVAVVVTHFDMFKKAAGRVMEYLAPHLDVLMERFQRLADTTAPIISVISDLLANVLVGAFEGAAVGIGIIIDGIAVVITGLTDVISGVVDFIVAIANGDWSAAWDALKGVVKGVVETITGLLEGVIGIITSIGGAVGGAVEKVGKFVSGKKRSNTSTVGKNASGTPNWKGGWTSVNEKGGEIMNLPSGTQIIPHDASRNTPVGGNISIAKLADQIVVREDADIEKIGDMLVRKIRQANGNRGGWTFNGNMA